MLPRLEVPLLCLALAAPSALASSPAGASSQESTSCGQTVSLYGQTMTPSNIHTIRGLATPPMTVAVDAQGNLYFNAGYRVQFIPAASGRYFEQDMTALQIYTIAGGGSGPEGSLATQAALGLVVGLALDAQGNVYISTYYDYRIHMVPKASGTWFGRTMQANHLYTIAGSGQEGFAGDGGPAASAAFNMTAGLAADARGVFISDMRNNRVRMVAQTSGSFFGQAMVAGHVYTVAGDGPVYPQASGGWAGDGIPATSAPVGMSILAYVRDVATDSQGNLYIASGDRVRMVPVSSGTWFGQAMLAHHIYTVAGKGVANTQGDGKPAAEAHVWYPSGLALDSQDNLYINEGGSYRVRMIPRTCGTYFGRKMNAHFIYTIAGFAHPSLYGFLGEGELATSATLSNGDSELAVDAAGNVIIADQGHYRLRIVPAGP